MKISKPIFFVLTSCLIVISFTNSMADTITSKTNGNWDNSSTWNGGIVPTASDTVVIASGNNVSTNGNRSCAGITISGTLSMDYGNILTVNGNVSGNGTWTTGSDPRIISLTGNWNFNGTSYGNGALAVFTGSNEQTFSGIISTGNGSFEINKTAGSVTLGSTLIVNGTLTITSGNIVTSTTNLLILGSKATINGGSVAGYVDGPLSRTIASTGEKMLSFPLGIAGIYRPLDFNFIESNSTSTTYTAEMMHSAPPSLTLPASLDGVSTIRYYTLSKSNGSEFTNGSVSLKYSSDDGVTDEENLRIAKSNGTVWQDLGPAAGGSAGQILSSATFSSLTYNIFVLAIGFGGSNPMPVELTSFTASMGSNEVKLNWNTATEIQNYGFEVERTSAGLSMRWEKIGFVKGSGNSNSVKGYSFTDKSCVKGKYSYRLKQVDTDGSFKYSEPVEVEISTIPQNYSIGNYPNPFNPTTIIQFEIPQATHVNLTIYNVVGERVATLVDEEMEAGVYQRIFSTNGINGQLSSGIYLYRLATDNGISITKKMILAK